MLTITKSQVLKMKAKVLVLEESLREAQLEVIRDARLSGCEVQHEVFVAAGSKFKLEISILEDGITSAIHLFNVQAAIDLIG